MLTKLNIKNFLKGLAVFAVLLSAAVIFTFGKGKKAPTAFGVRMPVPYKVCGIDVSRYQYDVDWKKVATTKSGVGSEKFGISYAFIKATEGKSLVDPKFEKNWSGSKKNNIIRGAYHYYKPNVNSNLQARNFISKVKLQKGDLPPVLDIEETGKYGKDNLKRGLKNWLTLVEKHYGVKPIIYCHVDYYEKNFLNNKDFKDYPFWIAHYYKYELRVKEKWHFWQHTDKAEVAGIRGKVSINAYNGSLKRLQSMTIPK